jgi:intracellular multiplication protein IcmL
MVSKERGLHLILQRNKQYFKNHNAISALIVLLVILNIALFVLLNKESTNLLPPRYIVTDAKGIYQQPCDVGTWYQKDSYCARVAQKPVVAFAKEAITKVWSLDFVNYHRQLFEASHYFSKLGWSTYLAQLNASTDFKQTILDKYRVVKPTVFLDKNHKVREGLLNGRVTWVVPLEIDVQYKSGASPLISQPYYVYVYVQRERVQNYPRRLAVTRYQYHTA